MLFPNFTAIPNDFIDRVMTELSRGAILILMVVARKTIGWKGRKAHPISILEFIRTTGLSKRRIIDVISELEKKEVIRIDHGSVKKGPSIYALRIDFTTGRLLTGESFCTTPDAENCTIPGAFFGDQWVQKTAPIERNNTNKPFIYDQSPVVSAKPQGDKNPIQELVGAFFTKFHRITGEQYVPTFGKDQKLMKSLIDAGYSVKAIKEVMDRYFADDFHIKIGFDLGRFVKAFNSLNSSRSSQKGGTNRVVATPGKYSIFESR